MFSYKIAKNGIFNSVYLLQLEVAAEASEALRSGIRPINPNSSFPSCYSLSKAYGSAVTKFNSHKFDDV